MQYIIRSAWPRYEVIADGAARPLLSAPDLKSVMTWICHHMEPGDGIIWDES